MHDPAEYLAEYTKRLLKTSYSISQSQLCRSLTTKTIVGNIYLYMNLYKPNSKFQPKYLFVRILDRATKNIAWQLTDTIRIV